MEVAWEAFRGKRIFLTGGSGFIGKWLIKRFIEKNWELKLDAQLYVLVRYESLLRLLSGIKEICPLPYSTTMVPIIGECSNFDMPGPMDYFIHGAIPRGDMRQWTDAHFEAAVGDMAHVLGQAKKAGVKRFLFLSSGLVETDIPFSDPRYLYYVTKLAQEQLTQFFSKEMSTRIARIYSVLGYGMDPHYAASQFITQALEKKEVTYQNPGPIVRRSYIYIEDLVDLLFELLNMEDPPPLTHFAGTQTSLMFLARQIAEYFQVPLKIIEQSISSSEHYAPAFDREDGTSITDAIAKTCEMYQRHHDQSLL